MAQDRNTQYSTGSKSPSPGPARDFAADFNAAWITHKITKDGIAFADEFGKALVEGMLTTAQIRNFFGEARRIEMLTGSEETLADFQTAFLLLKPKLAYAAARKAREGGRNDGIQLFKKVMDRAWDAVDTAQIPHYKNFMNFMEAVIAFHKAHGGRD